MKPLKIAAVAATSVVACVFAIGALHLPFARGWSARLGLGSAVGCPAKTVNAETLAAHRMEALRKIAGSGEAPSKPAFGFTLGADKDALVAWTKGARLLCANEGPHLRCSDVAAGAIAGVQSKVRELSFHFTPGGKLDAVFLQHVAPSAREAEALYDEIATLLEAKSRDGASPARSLDEVLASRSAERRYRDYAADLTAVNLGPRGFIVKGQAQAID